MCGRSIKGVGWGWGLVEVVMGGWGEVEDLANRCSWREKSVSAFQISKLAFLIDFGGPSDSAPSTASTHDTWPYLSPT